MWVDKEHRGIEKKKRRQMREREKPTANLTQIRRKERKNASKGDREGDRKKKMGDEMW